MDALLSYWWVVAILATVAGGYYLFVWRRKKVILVWNKYQKTPATIYGNAHFGKRRFWIKVCKDPRKELERLGSEKALIYHFSS